MMTNARDERLIQRCVDEELSADETRELLQRLDSLEYGWKTLACGLLEDRSLRRSLTVDFSVCSGRPANAAGGNDSKPRVSSHSKAQAVVQRWWSHPLTSLTLCAAIAFVGGMLIPDLSPRRAPNASLVAESTMPAGPGGVPQPLTNAAEDTNYHLQMTPGGKTLEVPVYSEVGELYRQDRNNPLFSRSGSGHGNRIQWMLVPVEGNKSMLIPVSEDTKLNMQ